MDKASLPTPPNIHAVELSSMPKAQASIILLCGYQYSYNESTVFNGTRQNAITEKHHKGEKTYTPARTHKNLCQLNGQLSLPFFLMVTKWTSS